MLETYGERLRAVRVAKALTQQQVANASGVHVITVCRWEGGRKTDDMDVVARVAAALDIERAASGNFR